MSQRQVTAQNRSALRNDVQEQIDAVEKLSFTLNDLTGQISVLQDQLLLEKAKSLYDIFAERWAGVAEKSLEPLSDALDQNGSIEESRVVLLKRASDRKRETLKRYEFVGPAEFATLMPARFKGGQPGTNPSSTLLRMKDRGEVIAVKQGGNYLYPVFQLDERQGDVYPELSALYQRAAEVGEVAWDVIHWLTSPQPTSFGFCAGDLAERAPDSLDAVFEALKSTGFSHSDVDAALPARAIPIKVLQSGDLNPDLFMTMVAIAFEQGDRVSDDTA